MNGFSLSSIIQQCNPQTYVFLKYSRDEIVDTDHVPISAGNVRTVEWTILPPGKYPWEVAKQHLAEYFNNVPDGKKYTIKRRHQVLADYTPDFVAIGEESFKGYVVYGYPCMGNKYFRTNEFVA